MAIKKNEQKDDEEVVIKNHKTLLKVSTSASTNKAGRKKVEDANAKIDKRNTFLLNGYQQEQMEKRMKELGFRSKTDYILSLLNKDISEFLL